MAQEQNEALGRGIIGIILIIISIGILFVPTIVSRIKDPAAFNLNTILKDNFDLKKDVFKKPLVIDLNKAGTIDKIEYVVNTYYMSLFVLFLSLGLMSIFTSFEARVQYFVRSFVPSLKNVSDSNFKILWDDIDKEHRDKNYHAGAVIFMIILSATGLLFNNVIVAGIVAIIYAVLGYLIFLHFIMRYMFLKNPKNKMVRKGNNIIALVFILAFTVLFGISFIIPISFIIFPQAFFPILVLLSFYAFQASRSYLGVPMALEESIHSENERTDLGENEAKNLQKAREEIKAEYTPDFSKVMYKAKPEEDTEVNTQIEAPIPEPLPAEPPKSAEVKEEKKPTVDHVMIPKQKVDGLKEADHNEWKKDKKSREIPGLNAFPENERDNKDDSLAAANESSDD
ncbi:MAG: hypothetical protein HPY53_12405 [Brevinematales bacterium]|nr:hypothetical protein [Brevinematales bacterium]